MLSILSEQGVPPPPRLSTKLGRLPIAGLNLQKSMSLILLIFSIHFEETSMIGKKLKLLARKVDKKRGLLREKRRASNDCVAPAQAVAGHCRTPRYIH